VTPGMRRGGEICRPVVRASPPPLHPKLNQPGRCRGREVAERTRETLPHRMEFPRPIITFYVQAFLPPAQHGEANFPAHRKQSFRRRPDASPESIRRAIPPFARPVLFPRTRLEWNPGPVPVGVARAKYR